VEDSLGDFESKTMERLKDVQVKLGADIYMKTLLAVKDVHLTIHSFINK
jgi:hypothetical protein